ncbi:hypothetical protein JZ751_029470 [Albula glossodonta]|uniref:FAD-binding PCMH-type domain-containing protein n=1 Tax=Albula glossodonta TaxID=121402 RepID=A0A8T2PJQ0_9TELE|nr:hypothetical protein JZ751_029470 [Albula glossodonta]
MCATPMFAVRLTGAKNGCGGGGCGACTVMVSRYDPLQGAVVHFSVNACLLPICALHGAAVVTVEGIGSTKTKLHPVQERIAKAHGSQCGFCTPGMEIFAAAPVTGPLSTVSRHSVASECCQNGEGGKKLCVENGSVHQDEHADISDELFHMDDVLPLDPTQDLIFPPELMLMAQKQDGGRLCFQSDRVTWISPRDLPDLLELKAAHPNAPLVGAHYPVVISAGRVTELRAVKRGKNGVTMGAACTLSSMKEELERAVQELDQEKSKVYQALIQTLRCLAGKQIRNMATIGGNILSANPKYDLNCILAAADCSLLVICKDGTREIPLNEEFFAGFGKTCLRPNEVLLSVHIPHSKPWEFISAFRQAQRREFAFPIVNAGMKVVFAEDTDVVKSLNIYYGGMGPTLVRAGHTCEELIGRSWDEGLLGEACRLLGDEVTLSPSAHGGRVEYRKTLTFSFLFKFYMQVLQELRQRGVGVSELPPEYLSALKPFKNDVPQGHQSYQLVSESQHSGDPVGRPNVHQPSFQQATGEAKYFDDMPTFQDELFLFMVTSTRAHAKIISVDESEALALPGVVAYVSARDVPGVNRRLWFDNPEELFAEEERKLERGNVDEAFEKVDRILEGEIYMGGQEHFYMETQGLIAVPRGEDGEMDLYAASQHAAFTQEVVGVTLGVASNKITCHVKRLGGGFGGKVMKIASLSAITATAAHKTGRVVRCVLDRGDDMLITSGRHPFLGKYKVGFMNDGTILAADMTFYSNGGCTLDESQFIMEKALLHMDNGYKIPNLRGRGFVCMTYLPSYTAFRGFGGPQGLTMIESVVHEVAVKCGLPPEKLFSPRDMVRCWEECLEKSAYHNRRLAIAQFNANNRWKKRGICAQPIKFGVGFSKWFYNQGAALVNIFKDGSVLVSHGGTEMGQGLNTKAIQIASRVLKVPMALIHIKETCTGNDACEKLMKRLEPVMKEYPKYSWPQWIVEAYCQRISLSATGFFMGPYTSVDWEKSEGMAYYYFTFGACCSEVEIDCLTGDHKNIRTDVVMDVGRSLNPAIDIGQIEGGLVQGIGLYTIEELQFSPEGVLLTRGPTQYKVPMMCDIPTELNGIGEPPVFFGATTFFAIKEAIAAARRESGLSGSFPLTSPATAERIRMACIDQFTKMVPSPEPGTFKPWVIDV